ncbi:putative UPF0481 protein At3g02645 isoform X1 [Quercus lobata]|uniref:putative UPF0481 protein At3g02645 isoform X1 n=1 Tax=Quercus lobata TaxID=97700 RepID=UPI0012477AD4|nr:putative UPF0481 protein At3g02645 isoform X1 [Quercus lobata]XP_030962887.1 putative UPF0481 protein At3g02645 isoform X1 [Quercus lobata]
MEHVISMEHSLPTNDESKKDGETVVPTDVEWTCPGSDWDRNRCNIPMELRSSLDDNGNPIEKNEENPTEVTFPKVPLRLRKSKGSNDYFDPVVISFGLYHHGKRELQEIDPIKDEAMLKFIKESGKPFPEFFGKVRKMNHLTRVCYVDCSEEKYCDDCFALIMLRDGCLISYLLDMVVDKKSDKLLELFVNRGGLLGYNSVVRDMALLENQIPLAVLELLMSLRYNNKKVVPKKIKQFIYFAFLGIVVPEDKDEEPQEEVPEDMNGEPQAQCLLECIQKEFSKVVNGKKEPSLCFNFVSSCKTCLWNPLANTSKNEPGLPDFCPLYRSLSELKVKGIHFKPIDSSHSLKKRKSFSVLDIEFIPGFFYSLLKLPPLILSRGSVILWNNLIAFEWSPACKTDAILTSYICFMNALIANPDDVKELRSKRILLNVAGSDEEMFKFFKEIAPVGIQDVSIYKNVRHDIEKHCRSKIRTWAAEITYKYFRNPWSALGLFAAVAVVVLSFVQTYFTIYPVKD